MPLKDTFDVLLLIARPAAGKSEIIDYLKNTPLEARIQRFHIGEFQEFDDFPTLWAWFEEDQLLAEMGQPRLYTDDDNYFLHHHFWDLLVRRICLDYDKKLRADPNYHQRYTTILEFSRGSEHGGYRRAFQHLSPQVVERMALLYVQVSWEESFRKNDERFDPQQPGSILQHSIPTDKMKTLYKETDWPELSAPDPEFLSIQEQRVPYAVFDNEDDLTTERGKALGLRLEEVLGHLWHLYAAQKANS